jgi:phenylalanyl-tRNA synthetase alpha chain
LRSLALNPYDDVLLACPGLVYRRDVVDRLHVGEPHQLDLWRVCSKETRRADLLEMIELVIAATLPGRAWRVNEVAHPYTTGGLEIEVADGARWVEVGECGLAARHVLGRAGLDQHGLAMGLGLDRLLMLRKGIDDIRLLRSDDPRVRGQMEDLAPYRSVSSYPETKRDLSLAVDAAVTAEDLGDRVRALDEAADAVEAVELLAETDYADLPPQAVARIGIREGQKNALVRLVLRHPTKTLSDEEANRLRDLVYAALHEGDAYEWSL